MSKYKTCFAPPIMLQTWRLSTHLPIIPVTTRLNWLLQLRTDTA